MTYAPFGSQGQGDVRETSTVRPYAVTGGRVRSELSVEVLPGAVSSYGLPPEKRAILQHAAHTYVSIAELSALLRLPLGVVRILVADMQEEGHVTVHTSTPVNVHTGHGSSNSGLSLSVLESVLNGISAL